nr:alpha-(1,3)-fucosyltransferase C-like [Cherax quadricarinatus]
MVLMVMMVVIFEDKMQQFIDPEHVSAWYGGRFRSPKIWSQLVPEFLGVEKDLENTDTYPREENQDGGGPRDSKLLDPPKIPYVKEMPKKFLKADLGLDPENPPLKKILVWVNGYGSKAMSFGFGRAPFQMAECEVDTCMVTGNRSFVPVEAFDAIIFHFRAMEPLQLPKIRSPHQRWVFWEVESASYVYQNPSLYNGLFNWTMTYRRDSDIPYPYGRANALSSSPLTPSPSPLPSSTTEKPKKNYAAGKTKMAAWFVSNCFTHSRREKLVNFMKKFIPVDVYGKCGPLKCSRDTTSLCYELLEKDYKFYFSFENSLCKDYVTEKLFSVLRYNVVPVVLGLGDYAHIVPPHSYINVLDFSNLQSLANYLKYLNNNDTAYNEYFKWKDHYSVDDGWSSTAQNFCELCKKLHNDTVPKTYQDIRKWFMSQGGCKKLDTSAWSKLLV